MGPSPPLGRNRPKPISAAIWIVKRGGQEAIILLEFYLETSFYRETSNIMRTESFHADDLARALRRSKIATMPELKRALGTEVDVTVFRKLKQLAYRTSYSHRGSYYALDETARFDENGLWSFQSPARALCWIQPRLLSKIPRLDILPRSWITCCTSGRRNRC